MAGARQVILGMSGGVDSALSASLLKERGFLVRGVYLRMGRQDDTRAREQASALGVEFLSLDTRELLEARVIAPFIEGYRSGRTPIPCVMCNPELKFKLLFDICASLGADYVATGHYARIVKEDGRFYLHQAASLANDQSYMLHRLNPEWFSRILFPLGDMAVKDETRARAKERGIAAHESPDSMEICFVEDGDYAGFIERRALGMPPGDFIDEQGRVLGRHGGIHRYTVGQRRGIGLSSSGRLYVRQIDCARNTVTLSHDAPEATRLALRDVARTGIASAHTLSFDARVKVRHTRQFHAGHVTVTGERAQIDFLAPVRAPAPGQSAVFYDQNGRVLGGGPIEWAQ